MQQPQTPEMHPGRHPYDRPTAEKRAFGARLLLAREQAQLTQAEAAKRLGYAQAVQLSNMENGNRMPPMDVLIRAAVLYGTTMDYLCGLSDDPDRDPMAATVRSASGCVAAEVNRLVFGLTTATVMAVRELRPSMASIASLARETINANDTLARIRETTRFDTAVPGGARLVRELGAAARLAQEQIASAARVAARAQGSPAAPILDLALGAAAGLPDLLRHPLPVPRSPESNEGPADEGSMCKSHTAGQPSHQPSAVGAA